MQGLTWDEVASLPSRECGLKYSTVQLVFEFRKVTPFAGVWIEIPSRVFRDQVGKNVTPFAGVWIEMS
ncbi:hypothetical protein RUMGNA_03718 [Mediterraneibacter gnavus ATCC 29149]|uniref:Uncharacterized protein n=1 Tax=Mediterraneibacter gnavus (strain ATCC 29149 / DSM 114966 / JCM 6515 / VPI C7-9) TaxID=411470 RepID=A7B802_MEDG7|nr:hypothetical protein RUMGNA_03718 [Mediterraneibacter gnavus ATCC 29149]